MRRFLIIFAVLSAFGLLSWWMLRNAGPARPVGETYACTHAGRTYAVGERRGDGDGCDACICGAGGWECMGLACPNAASGSISGTLSFPGEALPAQRVCAEPIDGGQERCLSVPPGTEGFSLSVPSGDWRVYATLESAKDGDRAYWSEFVACGMKAECLDHTPIVVTVSGGEARADPQDWYAAGQVDGIEVSPSRYVYSTHSYYPASSFFLRGRGFSAVEFHATPYPPQDDAPFLPIGSATSVSGQDGRQAWSLAVPPGFEAMRVKARASMDGGGFLWSPELRIIRPMDVPDSAR